jgi:hypothetical protein
MVAVFLKMLWFVVELANGWYSTERHAPGKVALRDLLGEAPAAVASGCETLIRFVSHRAHSRCCQFTPNPLPVKKSFQRVLS